MTNTTHTHRWLAGSGLALLTLVTFGCTGESAHPAAADVDAVWDCHTDADGALRAQGTVTNHTSKPSFYLITVDFAVDGHSFRSTTETVDQVKPGQTVRLESTVVHPPAGEPECTVSDVDRFKA